ncbi:MAG: T9SS type A sorting domain-containing protein [Saprospiraceae bacterium]|nr:T9SS type A sorting domain-containing protein [Saprospiraceae bacterium]
MSIHRLFPIALFLLPLTPAALAQVWSESAVLGGPGVESVNRLCFAPDGSRLLAGTYSQAFSLNGTLLSSIGENDLFLCSYHPDGTPNWAVSGGSILNDEVAGLTCDAQGNILITGAFWFSAQIAGLEFASTANPKALFLLKLNEAGQPLWGLTINGTTLKGVSGVQTDAAGNVWIAGFFGGQLFLGDLTLTASGQTDLFLAQFSPQGNLLWALRQGQQGDTRATALAITASGGAVVGGYFNSNTLIAGTPLTANTSDQDLFVAAFDAEGNGLWARKAGGVHDEDLAALAVDETGAIYAAGYFVGVIAMGGGISIQSATGNPDLFMLQYAPDGTPLRARALGGVQAQFLTGLDVGGGRAAICGYFLGDMSWDGFSLTAGSSFTGFFATFDYQLQGVWAQSLASSSGLYPQQIAIAPNGRLWTAGSFGGTAGFPAGPVVSGGPFDGFFLGSGAPVPATEIPASPAYRVFPNPFAHEVFLSGRNPEEAVWIFDASGRYCGGPHYADRLDLSRLPAGVYVLHIVGNGQSTALKVVKRD